MVFEIKIKKLFNLIKDLPKKLFPVISGKGTGIPETFVKQEMIYINICINGNIIKAFVDTGAETSLMCLSTALICGVNDIIDKEYKGILKGVGKKDIVGKIYYLDVQFGYSIVPCSFTIMEESDIPLIIGIDVLRRANAVIDFSKKEIKIGTENIKMV